MLTASLYSTWNFPFGFFSLPSFLPPPTFFLSFPPIPSCTCFSVSTDVSLSLALILLWAEFFFPNKNNQAPNKYSLLLLPSGHLPQKQSLTLIPYPHLNSASAPASNSSEGQGFSVRKLVCHLATPKILWAGLTNASSDDTWVCHPRRICFWFISV